MHVEPQGGTVLVGSCVPYGEANVWWPIASALAPVLDVDLGSVRPELRLQPGAPAGAT